jgi:hypothetical protein
MKTSWAPQPLNSVGFCQPARHCGTTVSRTPPDISAEPLKLLRLTINNTDFWASTPSSSETFRRFRGTYGLQLQGINVSQVETKKFGLRHFDARFQLGLFFDPEDGGDMFLLS